MDTIQLHPGSMLSSAGSGSLPVEASVHSDNQGRDVGSGRCRHASCGGQPVLELTLDGGTRRAYEITWPDEKPRLNSTRDFPAYDADCQ